MPDFTEQALRDALKSIQDAERIKPFGWPPKYTVVLTEAWIARQAKRLADGEISIEQFRGIAVP